MPPTQQPVTQRNHDELVEILTRIDANVTRLLEIWDEHAHLVLAFRRGGLLAARTAARRGNGAVPQD